MGKSANYTRVNTVLEKLVNPSSPEARVALSYHLIRLLHLSCALQLPACIHNSLDKC